MSDGTLNTRHSLTGQLQRLTPGQIAVINSLSQATLGGDVLEVVADDAKPYESEMFKPGVIGEFKNPEPPTDAVADAQAAYDKVLEKHAANSNVARDAKAVLDAATEKAAADQEAADKVAEQIEAGVTPATGEGTN